MASRFPLLISTDKAAPFVHLFEVSNKKVRTLTMFSYLISTELKYYKFDRGFNYSL